MPFYGYEHVYGHAIEINERLLPEQELTILLIMMSPYIIKQT